MVRNYERKTAKYSAEDMAKAVNLVREGSMGYKKAAQLYNLKWQTVRDQVKNDNLKIGWRQMRERETDRQTEIQIERDK